MRATPRSVAFLGVAGLALVALGDSLQSAPMGQPPGQATCDGTRSAVNFSVSSSREGGSASVAIPTGARAIKVVVTVPANQSRGAKDCGLGDERVDLGTCPAKGDCAGFSIKAGSGAGLDKCHNADQTLGPHEWPIPDADSVKLDFNAVTAKVATAKIELTCKR